MAKVFEISIRRARSAQPREYESTSAEVSLKAELEENENWETTVDGLFEKARDSVYRTLNLKIPARSNDEAATTATTDAPEAPANGDGGDDGGDDDDLTSKLDKQYSASELKAKLPTMDGAQLIAASKSSYKTVAKQAQDEIDRRSKAPAKNSEADDIPDGEDSQAPAKNSEADDIPDGGESQASQAPAKNSEADDIPDGDDSGSDPEPAAETEAELTEADVQNVLTDAVQSKGLKVARAKEIIGAFGKSRASEIEPGDRQAFVDKIKAEISKDDDGGLDGLV